MFRVLLAVDTWTCRHAARVVTLSEDMRRTLRARDPAAPFEVEIINNFELPVFRAERSQPGPGQSADSLAAGPRDEDGLELIFAGNLGRFQNLEAVVDALAELPGLPVRLHLVGDGSAKRSLLERVRQRRERRVRFHPFQEPAAAKAMIAGADFGIVSLLAGMERVACPSKTMTYLGQGCPLLAILAGDSRLARGIVSEGLGLLVAEPVTPATVAAAIRRAHGDRRHWREQRPRLREYARRNFSEQAIMARWDALLESL